MMSLFSSGRKFEALMGVLAGVLMLAFVAPEKVPDRNLEARSQPAAQGAMSSTGNSSNRNDALAPLKREALSVQAIAELFSPASWLAAPLPVVPPKPVAPPFPFYFVGSLVDSSGTRQVFLAQHGSGLIVTPKAGDVLNHAFQVESVGEDRLSVVYLPLKEKLNLPFASLGSEPGTRTTGSMPGAEVAPLASSVMPTATSRPVAVAGGVNPSLPPIAGLAPVAASTVAAPAGAAGGVSGASIASSTAPATSTAGGSSPLSPTSPPQGTPLGGAAPSGTLGSAPVSSGTLGTPPSSSDNSIFFGTKPTSGGPSVK